jgi:uncharacterized protein
VRVAVTGSTGLIGGALVASLIADGHEVVRIVRRAAAAPDEVQWDPQAGSIDLDGLSGVDAVAHFAGAGVGDHRWTAAYKRMIRDSRVLGTRTIARGIASLSPRPQVLVCGSAIGYYGNTGDQVVDEQSAAGSGFLATVVGDWENAASPARDAGIRVVHPRSGLVVAREGGAWRRMWPLFRLGMGGRLGSGTQYWSYVSQRDHLRALRRMLDDESLSGVYNVTSPNPATNAEVTKAMGELLHRPTFARAPSFAIRAALGEMASEVLGSIRAVPRRLLDAGFVFDDSTIEQALAAALTDEDEVDR